MSKGITGADSNSNIGRHEQRAGHTQHFLGHVATHARIQTLHSVGQCREEFTGAFASEHIRPEVHQAVEDSDPQRGFHTGGCTLTGCFTRAHQRRPHPREYH
jgi:hypothetical protein